MGKRKAFNELMAGAKFMRAHMLGETTEGRTTTGATMSDFHIRIYDTRTNSEITEGIGFKEINDREHYGRRLITVMNARGIAENVGILNQDGSVDAQPGYKFDVEKE